MAMRYLSVGLVLGLTAPLWGAEPAIVARVGDQAITSQDVDRELSRAVRKLPDDAEVVVRLKQAMLKECVQRELVLQALIAQQQAASSADVELEIARRKKELGKAADAWTRFLAAALHTEGSYRRETQWRLSWVRYLDKQTTDTNLQRYFDKHAADFDGTEVRVAHILWKVDDQADRKAWEDARLQAASAHEQIVAGKISFAAAAAKHSQAPTANSGGDIGFIGRRRPMPEAFSAAAFGLKSGDISQPVETSFGVHLIQCTEIKSGKRTWTESREELKAAVTRYLFDWLSEKQAAVVRVEYLSSNLEK